MRVLCRIGLHKWIWVGGNIIEERCRYCDKERFKTVPWPVPPMETWVTLPPHKPYDVTVWGATPPPWARWDFSNPTTDGMKRLLKDPYSEVGVERVFGRPMPPQNLLVKDDMTMAVCSACGGRPHYPHPCNPVKDLLR